MVYYKKDTRHGVRGEALAAGSIATLAGLPLSLVWTTRVNPGAI